MATANISAPGINDALLPSATASPNPIPPAIQSGIDTAHKLLDLIEQTVRKQVEDEGDISIPPIAHIILKLTPAHGSEEAIGFAVTMAEYLAFLADGMGLAPYFKTNFVNAWKEVSHV